MTRVRATLIGSLAIAATGVFARLAFALTSTILAVGTIPFLSSTEGPATVTFQHLVLAPGDIVPWHYHTGDVWAVIKSGVLTEHDPCGGAELRRAGDAFHEEPGQIHEVINGTPDPVDLYLTYIVPAGQPRTVFVSAPVCIGPPLDADQCKGAGWQTFTVPRMFRNQGDCVSFVKPSTR